jgi:2-methylcitrate dehydratase PrpD
MLAWHKLSGAPMMDRFSDTAFDRVQRFVLPPEPLQIPAEVLRFAALLLLDTLGVAAAAATLPAAVMARDCAVALFAAGPEAVTARMLFDGRPVSPAGAAFAGAAQLDNLDAHDGYNPTKGHLGVVVVPALMSFAQTVPPLSGAEMLATLVAGYEIGARAAIALHATAADYHSSGAWNGLAVAAVGARLRKLDAVQLREALGIAEYHGPRSQMMRVIDHPTMLRDGSAWGALAGASAVTLAELGFTGAPAITVEGAEVASVWSDLGENFLVAQHYIKPYPVCRWAHPLVDAALRLRQENGLDGDEIVGVELSTFREAARLYQGIPETSPVAQYAISFPVAAALANGRLSVLEVTGAGLRDPRTHRLVQATQVHESPAYSARFPAERLGEVTLVLEDGRRLNSGPTSARGGPESPLDESEIIAKFRAYAAPAIGAQRAQSLEDAVLRLVEPGAGFAPILELACRT